MTHPSASPETPAPICEGCDVPIDTSKSSVFTGAGSHWHPICYAGPPSFDTLLAHGLKTAGPSSLSATGMPWAFEWCGAPVTHETDDLYLIILPNGKTLRVERPAASPLSGAPTDDAVILTLDAMRTLGPLTVLDREINRTAYDLIPEGCTWRTGAGHPLQRWPR